MSKILDHSSFDTLLADLDRHRRSGMFHFRSGNGGVSAPWKLVMATTINVGPGVVRSVRLELRTDYDSGKRVTYDFQLRGGYLALFLSGSRVTAFTVTVVAVGGPPQSGGFSPGRDDFLHRQLDDNLRRVFS